MRVAAIDIVEGRVTCTLDRLRHFGIADGDCPRDDPPSEVRVTFLVFGDGDERTRDDGIRGPAGTLA